MKTILIPTDFNLSALESIPALCAQTADKEIRFVFVHLFKLSDSIGELLMLSRRSREYAHVSDGFYAACTDLKSRFPKIESIRIDFFYGSTVSAFRNFLEANNVDVVLEPSAWSYSDLNKSSVHPRILLERCRLPMIAVDRKTIMMPEQVHFIADQELAEA